MSIMNSHGDTVYLKLSPPALKERLVKSKTPRPLIQGKSESELQEFISQLLDEREIFYNQARITVDGVNLKPGQLEEILSR
jgi:shikimate kinase